MTGRQRHIVVDTLGLLLAVGVPPAASQDRDGAKLVLAKLRGRLPRLRLIWAAAGYAGRLVTWMQARTGWTWRLFGGHAVTSGLRSCPAAG